MANCTFCAAVLCTTVVHNDTHTYEQFLKTSVGLSFSLDFFACLIGLAFCTFFWFSLDCFVPVLFALVVLSLVSFQY